MQAYGNIQPQFGRSGSATAVVLPETELPPPYHSEAFVPRGVRMDASLRGLHTMGMECRAWAVADVPNVCRLSQMVQWALDHDKRTLLIGGGSNIAFAAEYIDALVVRLGPEFRRIEIDAARRTVRVGAATRWRTLIKECRDAGFGGLEYGWCIPGTIGGALAGNAGAAGRAVCEDTVRVWLLDGQGRELVLESGDFTYEYRKSSLGAHVILSAELRLEVAAPDQVDRLLIEMRSMRKSQPTGVASSGCVFKNPPGDNAGRVIESCGLKGLRVGDMLVSPVHANFIVNIGLGKPADLLRLMEEVRERVFAETGIRLETELRLIS